MRLTVNFLALNLLFVCVLVTFASEDGPECLVVGEVDKPITVVCPVSTAGEIKWTKNNKEVKTEDKKYVVDATNKSLTVLKISKESVGIYICSGSNENKTVAICAAPHVTKYDKPKNVIEGDPFQTDCVAWGYPEVHVEWTSDKNFSGAEDRKFLKNGTTTNSILRIERVQYEDSGAYTCIVQNSQGTVNATIEVNVKDKLAALWPFLGICAEVAVLCIIIFFYERRRAKHLEKEAAQSEETDRMTANNDAKVSDDVRHRK